MKFTHPIIAMTFVAAALGVGACGDDEERASTTTAPAETGAEAPVAPSGKPVETVDLSETEYKLDPADPQVSKSGVVEFNASNDGGIDHALEVEGPDGDSETETIAPGDSASVSVDLPAGEYTWYCPIANHRELGMEGTITVAGGSGGESSGATDEGSAGTDTSQPSGSGGGY